MNGITQIFNIAFIHESIINGSWLMARGSWLMGKGGQPAHRGPGARRAQNQDGDQARLRAPGAGPASWAISHEP